MKDTLTSLNHNSDSTSFVLRTDVLDLLSTLVEGDKFQLTIGLEFVLNKKYSMRLRARTEHMHQRFFTSTEFRSGPELIKYFAKNKNGSFYGGVFLEYFFYDIIKYDGNFTYERQENKFSPGITTGYCYLAAKHILIEPSIRIGYLNVINYDTPIDLRIGLYAGYLF